MAESNPINEPRRLNPVVLSPLAPPPVNVGQAFPRALVTILTIVLVVAVALTLSTLYENTQQTVTLMVDSREIPRRTHQTTVAGLLSEAGITLSAQDQVEPALETPIQSGLVVQVRRARPVVIAAGNQLRTYQTHARTVSELLAEIGVSLAGDARVVFAGQPLPLDTTLATLAPPVTPSPTAQADAVAAVRGALLARPAQAAPPATPPVVSPTPIRLEIRRAVPIQVRDGGVPLELQTVAATLGEALQQAALTIYPADRVMPGLDTPITPDLKVTIVRAKPVTLVADGRSIPTRTQADQVKALLKEMGVSLGEKDYVVPPPDAGIVRDMTVRVVRVREEYVTEENAIPYRTLWQPDESLELDQRRIIQAGVNGIHRRTIKIVYEDGKEITRVLDREWIEREPTTRIIGYGTQIVLRTMMTPEGPITYWRTLRVLATWYNASHGWWPPGHPFYGMTRTGRIAGRGIVAVDPYVINLHTRMYVPGYGFADAEDTGGLIKGMRIDLAFDEWDPNPYHLGWVTIYLLAPPPPAAEINWVLPDYPVERR